MKEWASKCEKEGERVGESNSERERERGSEKENEREYEWRDTETRRKRGEKQLWVKQKNKLKNNITEQTEKCYGFSMPDLPQKYD